MAKRRSKKLPSSPIEFFKVFLSDLCFRELSLPPAFVEQLNGTAPESANLKDHTGKIWDVQLIKTETNLTIKEGWKKFASHHSLVDGDFLVFKYDGNSLFFVDLYGRNGLKKGKALSENEFSVHVKEEIKEENTSSPSTSGSKRKYSEMGSNQTRRSVGRPRGRKSKVRRTAGTSGGNGFSPKQTTVTNRGRPNSTKPIAYNKPKNPHFEAKMTKTTNYCVYVHRKVLKENNLRLREKIKLCDEDGTLWPVKVCFRSDGRILINEGWRAFRQEHKVVPGNSCVFEFIPREDNIIKIMKVQIVRKNVKPEKRTA